MANTLRFGILMSIASAFGLNATAQSETFTGVSGTNYYVNYEDGFIGQTLNGEMKLISPQYFVERDLIPMAFTADSLTAETRDIYDRIQYATDALQKLIDGATMITNGYVDEMIVFNKDMENLLYLYLQLSENLDKIYNSRQKTGIKRARETKFEFNVSGTLTDLDYTLFMVNFTRGYLIDLLNEIIETADEYEAAGKEMIDILTLYQSHASTLTDNYNYLADYFNKNAATMTKEDCYWLLEQIKNQVGTINSLLNDAPKNPASYAEYLLKMTAETLDKTYSEYLETVEEVNNLNNQLVNLAYLPSVLYAGIEGDPFGLYYYIKDNGGVLNIPSTQQYVDIYTVTGINGNIFTPFYEVANPNCTKLIIPATIKSISDNAFAVNGLETIEVNAIEVPDMTDDCFTTDVYKSAALIVPDGTTEAYASAPGWKNFANIRSVTESGIESVIADGVNVKIEGGVLYVSGADGLLTEVFSISGASVYKGYDSAIQLPAHGVYIVRIADKPFKVAR
ncbi:hypothetical protein [uncultured Duncaniella sp.]|uniref:hypothetical protein n=1 Tax=uncultured Duncaniella sp. TaxID=2768039 RepID=UPI002711F6FA|nr:hypothetical protein [uncultured Duncaniella sp.]